MRTADRKPEAFEAPPSDPPKHRGFFREMPGLVLIAIVLALLIKTLLFQAFFIPTASMEPTLIGPGDRVLVNKVPYYLHDPRRGDVIVFSNPNGVPVDRGVVAGIVHWLGQGLGFSKGGDATCVGDTNADEDFIKRVIGLPGDTVQGKGGAVYVNGAKLAEPYLPSTTTTDPFASVTVPQDRLFVMGDNRGDSCDSRFSLGLVPLDHVIGKAFVIIWPPTRMGLLH